MNQLVSNDKERTIDIHGVLIMDFPGEGLILKLIEQNHNYFVDA
jgi:hypothetical protein